MSREKLLIKVDEDGPEPGGPKARSSEMKSLNKFLKNYGAPNPEPEIKDDE